MEQTEKTQKSTAASMPRRAFLLRSMILVATPAVLAGCGGGNSHSGSSIGITSKKITIMTNPIDPMLAKMSTADGSTITIYGNRDASGSPITLDRLIIAQGTDTLRYTLNADGSPSDMTAADGTRFQFNWKSPTQAVLTINTSDGQNQINTIINKTTKSVTKPTKAVSLRQGKEATISFGPLSTMTQTSAVKTNVHRAPTNGTCTVTVTQCGNMPAPSADVWVVVMSNGENRGEFPAYNAGNGQFVATIPTKLAVEFNPGEYLKDISEKMGPPCDWTEGYREELPTIISTELTMSKIPIAGAKLKLIIAAITALMGALEKYCTTIGYSPAPTAPSILDKLLEDSTFLNQDFDFPMGIKAYVVALPENVYSQAVPAPSEGPFPNLSIALGGQTTVRNLTLNPDAPAAGVSYVGTADIYCLPSGTTITLSIVGTDGYTNSQSYNVPNGQTDGTFTLNVPGAAAGVQDVVTVTVQPPTGSAITLTASLIFG